MSKPISAIYKNPETRGGITVKKTYNVPVKSIYIEAGFNVKGKIYQDTIDGMVKAYISGQILPDIVVEPQDNGTFKVIDGHHRFTAILEVIRQGHDYRRITVQGFNGSIAEQVALMVTSSQGRNLNPVERAEAYNRLTLFNLTNAEIAETFLVSFASVLHHISIYELDDTIKTYILDGKIAADYALELCRKHDVDEVIAIIDGSLTSGQKKATRKNTGGYRPAMGKRVVNILSEVKIIASPKGVRVQFTHDDWDAIKEVVAALGDSKA